MRGSFHLEREPAHERVHLPGGAPQQSGLDRFLRAAAEHAGRALERDTRQPRRASNIAVGGLTLGADPLVAGLMLHSAEQGRPLEGFFVRRTTKDHGLRGQVEGNLAGHKRIAILDDVITSGESVLIAAEAAESYKAQVVRVLAVVDRGQGASQIFQQRGLPFTTLFSIEELLPAERG